MKKLLLVLLLCSAAYGQLRVPSLQITDKLADTTFLYKTSVYVDTGLIYKRLKVGYWMVDSATGRDTGKVAVRDTLFVNSLRMGKGTPATGYGSISLGHGFASGDSSFAQGTASTVASGKLSFAAAGAEATASGDRSVAFHDATASWEHSFAWGTGNASADYATAFGVGGIASATGATAWGGDATASGFLSTAIGTGALASGELAFALGLDVTASGKYTIAMGIKAKAKTDSSFCLNLSSTTDSTRKSRQAFINAPGGVVLKTDTLSVVASDSLTISHATDTTYFNTTAAIISFNKPIATKLVHSFQYFSATACTIAVAVANTPYPITNAGKNLYTVGESDYVTSQGDSAIIQVEGDYKIFYTFVLSGANGNDWRIYTQDNGVSHAGGISGTTTGTSNFSNMSGFTYFYAHVGDHLRWVISNVSDPASTNDPIIRDGKVLIEKMPE